MKKLTIIFGITTLFLLSGLLIYAGPRTGKGGEHTASTTPQTVTGLNLRYISIENTGSANVFALVNTTTNILNIRATNNTAIVVAPSRTFTFTSRQRYEIKSLQFKTTNSTSSIVIDGF